VVCPGGGTRCGTACADLNTDAGNCGRCGNVCTVGQHCSAGACVCDQVSCSNSCCNGNVCVASQTDSMCGISGAACGPCGPTGSTVAFSKGKASGAMTGWGWVALGPADAVSSPTCQGAPFTPTGNCLGGPDWNSTSALCLTGSIPAVAATNPDYINNWGVQIGIDATINADGRLGSVSQALGQSFTSIAITVSGSPSSGLRAMVHRKGDAVGASYCAPLTSGAAIPFTAFNTKCYASPPDGVALTMADVPNIDQVGVQVSSTFTAITVTNLCITGITFASGALASCAPTPAGGWCATAGYLYCGGSVCCSPSLPHYCPATDFCYATEAAALAACGNTACSNCVPATATNSCTPSPPGTCYDVGYLFCGGTVCCAPTLPYYCPAMGLCYATAAGAAAVCGGGACLACGT
jgi:hypothetical protein